MDLLVKAVTWVFFALVMLVMVLVTLVVLCFFIPFVGIKAFWQLILEPIFR